jgi:hypothetical protein
VEYNRDVRPILAENCFACHGPDSAARKADLRLDRHDDATKAGAITPGEPDESTLVERIFSDDPGYMMPPPKTRKKLTAVQKELMRRWIAAGAEYQPHWSFIPPSRAHPPAVKNEAWVRNPIDRFILAKLEARGLQPAAQADRRTLARRLSLDLTGLPPEPEEVEAFVADPAPDAYERFVEHLLRSPHWGEHRGRYWLDAARYADTHGIHFDNFREMWSYREWVIGALNRNMPFDQFTIEQLAGDLLPGRTLQQQIASGFNRCNITTNEGGVIPEEYLVLYTRDRTETVSQVWLGLTAGCAVCHDHKFDDLSMHDFYSMAAFFNNTTQGAMDGNIKDTPPIVVVPRDEERPRWEQLPGELGAARERVEGRKREARPDFDAWLAAATPEVLAAAVPQQDLYLHAPLNEGQGQVACVRIDSQPLQIALAESASWQPGLTGTQALQVQGAACELADAAEFEKDQAFSCAAWVKLPANDSSGAICARMDNANQHRGWDFWVQRRQVGTHIINSWPGDALKVVGKAQVPANEWVHVAVSYDGSGKAAGVQVYYNGQPQELLVEADRLQNTTKTTVPFKIGQRHTSEPLSAAAIQDLRIYKRSLAASEIESLAKATRFAGILAKAAEERTDDERNEVYPWWLGTFDKPFQGLAGVVASLEQEQNAIKARGTIAHVMHERDEAAMAYLLFRGEYDKRRDPVTASTPRALPPMPEDLPRNRLGFAQWLLRPDHPLTTRVTVNRFWQEVFGTGLVKTSGDFGVAGELPSHPELLDWLAVEFRETGWDVKRFFRLLVTSATYRQAAVTTPEKLEKDPTNRLLSRGPRFRMDGEMIRDYALASSGLLIRKLGGPSVKPYQPEGVWEAVAMIGSNTRDYRRDSGESLYRRSLYTFWKRSAPPAAMEIFNAPNRETCAVRRERTNTPLQALVALNDVQFVEAARHLAERALKEGVRDQESGASRQQTGLSDQQAGSERPEAGLDFIARRLLARSFRPDEIKLVRTGLNELLTYYRGHPDDAQKLIAMGESKPDPSLDASTLAAWTMTVNELMNLDEVLNK